MYKDAPCWEFPAQSKVASCLRNPVQAEPGIHAGLVGDVTRLHIVEEGKREMQKDTIRQIDLQHFA